MNSEKSEVDIALETFRNPYSCAQTVYKAFKPDASEAEMQELKALSGGRAEGNVCGALYAARKLVSADRREELDAFFLEHVGDLRCREIKTKFRTPCQDCVRIAAKGVEKFAK